MGAGDYWPAFEPLLLTWNSVRTGALSTAQLEAFIMLRGEQRVTQSLEYEQQYGVGHYDDRRQLLRNVLGRLAAIPKVDLGTVLAALQQAKRTRTRGARVWRQVEEARAFQDQKHQVFKHLRRWADRADELFRDLPPDEFTDALHVLQVRLWLYEAPKKRLGRPRPGHQKEPWLKRAYDDLRAAGVGEQEMRQELLSAIGLTRYRV